MLTNVCCKSLLILCFPNKSNIFTCCIKNGLIWKYLEMNHNACCSFEALIIQEEPAPFIQAQINQTWSLWNMHVGGWEWKRRWRDKLVHVIWGSVSVDLDCRLWDGPASAQMCFLCVGLPNPTAEKPFDLFLKRMFSGSKVNLYQMETDGSKFLRN